MYVEKEDRSVVKEKKIYSLLFKKNGMKKKWFFPNVQFLYNKYFDFV